MNIIPSYFKTLFLISLLSILTACSSDRYQQKHDSTPTRLPNKAELQDAIPRAEAHSRGGNKHYQVFNKPYKVLSTAQGFEETGKASWYGKKFHGHLTSNGEIYDMYAMSAAHKHLPLPTYLKVTNLANNKSVIVRVNDRGPFHQSRILDLSYSAAFKLDMLKTGTADVKITAITDFDMNTGRVKPSTKETITPIVSDVLPITVATAAPKKDNLVKKIELGITTPYIQVVATSKKDMAVKIANQLALQYKQKTQYPEQQGLYRVQIGPIDDIKVLNTLLTSLKENGYPNAYPRALSK